MRPGGIHVANLIATSGHSLHHTSLASQFARIISSVDPKLDDLSSRSEIFSALPHETVKAMKLKWHLRHMDLGLFDKATSTFHVLKYGPT